MSLDRPIDFDIERPPQIEYLTIGTASAWVIQNATSQVPYGSALIGLPGFGKTPALRGAFEVINSDEQSHGIHAIPVWIEFDCVPGAC